MFRKIIPIAFPNYRKIKNDIRVIAADVGGTKTYLALFQMIDNELTLVREAVFASQEYPSFGRIVRDFQKEETPADTLSIGFAGPVLKNAAKATNLSWMIDGEHLKEELNINQVLILNDLEASAFGLAALNEDDLITIHKGNTEKKGNAAIIAPGTGLGEAGMFWDGTELHPFATEGGHTDFGTRKEIDIELYKYLHKKYEHVSWERVVSGMGIFELYKFLLQYRKTAETPWMQEKIALGNAAAAISFGAKNGCPISEETFSLFWRYLAEESSNLALKLKATGGLFIAGGIAPKNLDVFNQKIFLNHFYEAGRLRPMLQEIPVHIVLNEKIGLLGAALYGFYGAVQKPNYAAIS